MRGVGEEGVRRYLGSGLGWGEPFGSWSVRGCGGNFLVFKTRVRRSVINKSPRVGWDVPLQAAANSR